MGSGQMIYPKLCVKATHRTHIDTQHEFLSKL